LSIRARRWSPIFSVGLAAILLASAGLLVARRQTRRQITTHFYTPLTGEADWEGDWDLSSRGADPSQSGSLAHTDRVIVPFTGTGLALRVRRSNYRAYLWIRIDGEPANRLPQTDRGAYLVLSSPDYEPQVVTLPVASGLSDGPHVAEIVADRGWDQWPLVGWRVERGPDTAVHDQALAVLAASGAVCLIGAIGFSLKRQTSEVHAQGKQRREDGRQRLWYIHAPLSSMVKDMDSTLCLSVSLLITAGVFYASPWLPLTLVSGAVLTGLIVLRLDLGLALVALSAPFYLHPRSLLNKSFSMAEIVILLCLASWALRQIAAQQSRRSKRWSLSSPDLAVMSLVLVAATSTLFADRRHIALRELRVAIVEPALFYMMVRTTKLGEGAIWRIVDGFVAGATVVAVIGLLQYALGVNVITAEQGFRRLRSVYGSPNNAALYLGRALPVLLAVAALAEARERRVLYGLFAAPVGLAILLSFSRAAILLGIPFSLLVLGLLAGGRWRWITLGLIVLAAVGIIPLMNTPRFAGLLDPHSGTLFFRLQLWRASWKMFQDHPWLGVGPDNFLYQYRGRYILPAAWQEPHLSHAHNLLLTYATRLGVLGLLVGLWLHAAFWWHSLPLSGGDGAKTASTRNQRALALGLMGSMAYSLAHGLVDASTFFVDLALAFLLVLSLVQWLTRWRTDEQRHERKHE